MPRTVASVLDGALAADPDREALVTRSRRLSYAELDREADRAASALRGLGLRPGDRLAVSLPNEADLVVAFHGAMRLGAVWVGVNRVLAAPEKCYLLEDAGASLVLADEPVPGATVRHVGLDEWGAAVAGAADEPTATTVDPHAPAGIAYTSGTTGRPKGAVHSQWNLLLPGAALVAERGYGPELRKGDCLPLTILNLLVLTTLLTAQAGGCSIVMDRTDPEGIAEWIRTERVTTWNGPPTLLHALAGSDAVRPGDLASLDEVWNGGADCPDAVRRRFEAKFAREVLCTYGLTEAPAVVAIDPRGGPHRAGSSGRPLGHLRLTVVDDDGAEQPPGETGEILVTAADDRYRPMLGYWRNDGATAATLAGGALHTGDVGFVDDHGELHVRDRKTLVVLRGGGNVYPAEVERVLHEAPGVAACAVLGVPDERLGERVVAAVEPEPGAVLDENDLRAHCALNLARYKVPERFVVVEQLPRNAMGKIVRSDLATLF
ncbi:MAG: AMP-dependent synthetase and ligase [Acidimicrobiales bacterium]|nr:AMP-dependent synthetase and ligase [Acidimicrobiales bacterium]